jgi:hypothetical protein
MIWLKKLFGAIGAYFKTGRAASDASRALAYAGKALPVVAIAVDIVTGMTPTKADDIAWAAVKRFFPTLFDGSEKSPDEIKLAALAYTTERLKVLYPELDTSIARAAAQLAYLDLRAGAKA